MRASWTALALGGAAMILAGCASTGTPEDRAARCESARALLTAYQAAREAGQAQGREPSTKFLQVEAAASAAVALRCLPPPPQ
jgi:hypothetical protein